MNVWSRSSLPASRRAVQHHSLSEFPAAPGTTRPTRPTRCRRSRAPRSPPGARSAGRSGSGGPAPSKSRRDGDPVRQQRVRAVDGEVARIAVFPGVVAGAASTVAHTLLPHRTGTGGTTDHRRTSYVRRRSAQTGRRHGRARWTYRTSAHGVGGELAVGPLAPRPWHWCSARPM